MDDFWALKQEDGTTYDDLFTSYIVDNAKTYLCALYLFDQFGLSLSDADVEEVDTALSELVDQYADGNKSEFNTVLAAYGFNYKTLRECYLTDKKVTVLQNYLFSDGGPEAVTDDKLEAYYKSTYVRITQICIFINQCPEVDSEGKYVTGDDGNIKYRDMSALENQAASRSPFASSVIPQSRSSTIELWNISGFRVHVSPPSKDLISSSRPYGHTCPSLLPE